MFKDWTPPWRGGKEKDEKGAKERRDMRPDEPPIGSEAFASVREKPRDSFADEQKSIFNIKKKLVEENGGEEDGDKIVPKKDNPKIDTPDKVDPVDNPDEDDDTYTPGHQNPTQPSKAPDNNIE